MNKAAPSLLRIVTDDGAEGYCFGANKHVIEQIVKPAILGEDPFYRERIGQRLRSRLMEMCAVVAMTGPDRRLIARQPANQRPDEA